MYMFIPHSLKLLYLHNINIRDSKQCYLLAQIEGKDLRKYFLNIGEIVLLPGLYTSITHNGNSKINDFNSLQSGMSYQVIINLHKICKLIINKHFLFCNNFIQLASYFTTYIAATCLNIIIQ